MLYYNLNCISLDSIKDIPPRTSHLKVLFANFCNTPLKSIVKIFANFPNSVYDLDLSNIDLDKLTAKHLIKILSAIPRNITILSINIKADYDKSSRNLDDILAAAPPFLMSLKLNNICIEKNKVCQALSSPRSPLIFRMNYQSESLNNTIYTNRKFFCSIINYLTEATNYDTATLILYYVSGNLGHAASKMKYYPNLLFQKKLKPL